MAAGNWKEMYSAAQKDDLDLVRYHIQMVQIRITNIPKF